MTGNSDLRVGTSPLVVSELTTDHEHNPLGVDAARPRLAWLLESGRRDQSQSAYQVLVASGESLLSPDMADIWDSGKVSSAQSAGIPYGGRAPASATRYHWRVRCWDADGRPTAWSDPAWWETGLFDEADWSGAQWIGAPEADGPQFRKDFAVRQHVERARIHVSGLGYHVLTIDGVRVGDSVLDPGVTSYDRTALYVTHDVTEAVRDQGPHVVGITLGRGFYALRADDTKYWGTAPWLGSPRLRLKLEIEHTDGTHAVVVSDASWLDGSGPTIRDSVYLGETYDARRAQPGWDRPGFDDDSWSRAVEVAPPTANLRSQRMQPIRVVGTLRAVEVVTPRPGTQVFKFRVVTAGWVRLHVTGPAGTEVTLRYGETLLPDGTVDNRGDAGLTNGPVQTDRYVLRGDGPETWEPAFSYKGFQYVQIDGYPGVPTADDVIAQVVHSDVPSTGSFSCSEPLLNAIHDLSRRTMLNNLHSVMTDTPLFEKRGWLGDVNVLLPATIGNFGLHRFYRNWLRSAQDDQAPDGAGVDLSPNPSPAGYTDPIWAGVLVDLPWQLFQDYGDRDVLEASYDSMARYVDHLTRASEGLIQQGFYGDWVSPATSGTFPWPPEGAQLTATAYFYRYATVLLEAARELGHDAEAERFGELAGRIRSAFNAEFLDPVAGIYRTGTEAGYRQTSNAVPLSFGLVPDDLVGTVTQNLVADVRARGNHLNTGHAGTKELLPALTANGHVDLAFAIATQRTYPSWGFWIENGATTLWEAWETNTRSRDHAFLGSIEGWFYRDLAGIRPAAPGYAQIEIRPHCPAALHHVKASVRTVHGTVASNWERQGDELRLTVRIPANTTAQVFVPAASPGEHDHPAEGVRYVGVDGDRAVLEVGSGTYQFQT